MFDVNWVAILAASAAAFLLGALWYSPVAFFKLWLDATGIDPMEQENMKPGTYALVFIQTLLGILVYVELLDVPANFSEVISNGLLVGVGLVGLSMGINYQFVFNRFAHWLIDTGFHAARFIVAGLILMLMN